MPRGRKKQSWIKKKNNRLKKWYSKLSFTSLIIKLFFILVLSIGYVLFLKDRNIEDDNIKFYKKIFPVNLEDNGFIHKIPDMRLIIQDVMENIPSGEPIQGTQTSKFGWRKCPTGQWTEFHPAIDITAPEGTPIIATAAGQITMAAWYGGYGYTIRIQHKYGFETIYAHCRSLAVAIGQSVYRGQIIGYLGHTGRATGSHVHYEIRYLMPIDGKELENFLYMKKVR